MTGHLSRTRAAAVLIGAKTRLLWNTLRAKQGFWHLLLIGLFGLCWCVFAAREAAGATKALGLLFLAEPARQLLAMALAYAVLIVFTSDILMGHTLNAGQMSTDTAFLSTLPVTPGTLLVLKLYERLVTDWMGFIFLFSGFLGLAWPGSPTLAWIALSCLLYLETSLATGLAITLAGTLLQRLARPSTIENLFSLLGYVCAFIGLAPVLLVSSAPMDAALALLDWTGRFGAWPATLLTPARWLADTLLDGFSSPSFVRLQVFWAATMAAGSACFHLMARLNWPGWVHAGRRLNAGSGRRLLTGLLRKEALLLRSDWNILTNSLLMPISIIIMQLWALRGVVALGSETAGMNIMAAALMYFSMFGPLNSMGSEGRAISLLETLPVSPGRIIGLKTLFWSVIAACCFVPAAIGTGLYLGFPTAAILRTVAWTVAMIPALVWVAVSMSALYARYEGKVLQQRSHLTAKLLTPLVMALIVPVKDASTSSLIHLGLYLALAVILHDKAVTAISRRLDPDGLRQPRFDPSDAFLILIVLMGIQRLTATIAALAVPPALLGLWPWLLASLVSVVLLSAICWSYARARFPSPAAALGWKQPAPLSLFVSIAAALALGGIAAAYLAHAEAAGIEVFASSGAVWSIATELFGPAWSAALFLLLFCVATPLVEEMFFRGFCWQALAWTGTGGIVANGLFFALSHPPISMPTAFLLGTTAALLFRRTRSLWPGVLLHSVYNFLILIIHASRL
ncbi:MAG TPA: type II CAAX endopeptidase family protein [Candidatus Ozemobacteraceae bacterium]|nr:type II CAAX endopeptidase family protein [Candidatus Ozemobacteraceae bacterium]